MWWPAALVCLMAVSGRGAKLEGELGELAQLVRDNCIDETGVDAALLAKVDDGADLPPDGTLNCYIKCTMELGGVMSSGEVDTEAVLNLMPPDMAARTADAIRGCGSVKGADDCETAFLTQQCWQKANRDDYFLI